MRKLPRSKSSKAKLKRESEVNNGLVLLNNGQNQSAPGQQSEQKQSAAGQQSEAAEVPEVVSKEPVSMIPQLIGKTFNYLGDSISSGMSYLQRMGVSMVEGASGPLVCTPTPPPTTCSDTVKWDRPPLIMMSLRLRSPLLRVSDAQSA